MSDSLHQLRDVPNTKPVLDVCGIARNTEIAVENGDGEELFIDGNILEYTPIKSMVCTKCRIGFDDLTHLINHLKRIHTAPNNPDGRLTPIDGNKIGTLDAYDSVIGKRDRKEPDRIENYNIADAIVNEDREGGISDAVNDGKFAAGILKGLKKGKLKIEQKHSRSTDASTYCGDLKVNLTKDSSGNVKKYEMREEDFTFDGTRYVCNRCKKAFASRRGLRMHLKCTHDRVGGRVACPYCDERFVMIGEFKAHLRTVHEANENLYTCGACDRSFSNAKALDHHHRGYHLQEKNFKCDTCDYECYSKHLLMHHMTRHSGERRFHCKYCPKSFKRWNEHARHERIHTGYKPYECGVCGKTFAQKASINYHMSKFHPGVDIKVYKLNKL
ncbi:Myoneurin [Eumeta japonica]|uniref:Myoneurin n=1 Tax=Eumeta variegata TaxID=151549 RepID=A0A4C1VX11_EUMVA|nr:Myoneurin [Eumeta japonica]